MKLRHLFLFLFLCICSAHAKKNVLLIISDDLNTDFGVYGHKVVKTPEIDRFAENALVFDNAYCQFPVCNPSRTSFLSGLRPENTGVINNKDAILEKYPNLITLPSYMRDNGYFTGSTGKIFHDSHTDDKAGWDHILNTAIDVHAEPGEGRVLSDKVHFLEWRSLDGGDESFYDGLIAKNAIKLMDEATESDKPFFLAVGFIRPHDPFFAPSEYFDMYPLESLKLPEKEDVSGLPKQAWPLPKWKAIYDTFNDQDKLELLRSYYAGISYMDRQFGKVMHALEERGLADDTIVLFLGDHGYHLWEKDWFTKATQFERSALTPMIVRQPDSEAPRGRTSSIVELIDIFPTIVDYCDLAMPLQLEGQSFLGILNNPSKPGKMAALTELAQYARSIRTPRWRYIEWYAPKPPHALVSNALYDHDVDPREINNVVGEAEHADVVADLQSRLYRNQSR
ncbi:sulfatase [Coraliomargarita sp. W4R53]